MRAPERFDHDVLGGRRVPDDPHDPTKHFVLEFPEQRLERRDIVVREAPEQFAVELVGHDSSRHPYCAGRNKVPFAIRWEGFGSS